MGVIEVKDTLSVRERWNGFVALSLSPLAVKIKEPFPDEFY